MVNNGDKYGITRWEDPADVNARLKALTDQPIWEVNDDYYENGKSYKDNPLYQNELNKTAHRDFTTAYFLGENKETVNYTDSQSKGTMKFTAVVIEGNLGKDYAVVEMRNRFTIGSELEILSPTDSFNKVIKVSRLEDLNGNAVEDAKIVQQKLKLFTDIPLSAGDILRTENK